MRTAAFSREGKWVVTSSDDKSARVWNAATGEPIANLAGHREQLHTAVFSPDGQRVVTASSVDPPECGK
jgi:WD40 repeat protein